MTDDATFEQGGETPLNLVALDPEDVKVVSSLVQDAVFPATEMTWRSRERRFAVLINRFRWEYPDGPGHGPERVRSLLVVDNVLRVASQGIDRHDADLVLSLLAIEHGTAETGHENLELILAGDGMIRLQVEAVEVTLKDVTRPYRAPSGKVPDHEA